MLETIAATCRALASDARLLLLYHLSRESELAATLLAGRAGMEQGLASHHLARLAAQGLVRYRRSGAHVFYQFPAEPQAQPGRFAVAPVVRRALRGPTWAARGWREPQPVHVSPAIASTVPEDVVRALDILFEAATAFTSVRPLQILRLLLGRETCDASSLTSGLSMSPDACRRHLDKLQRRRYVPAAAPGVWTLTKQQRTPCHRELFLLVAGALA